MTKSVNFAPYCLLILASCNGQAAEYFFEPRFSSTERYDSNINMRQKPPQDNWITTLSPGIDIGFRHEMGELKSNFTWNQLFYTNQSELNIDEQLFRVDYQHNTERFNWSIKNSYSNRSSLNTEDTGTGIFFSQIMRKQISIAPSVTYTLTEKSSLTFDYAFEDAKYEKNKNSFFLSDYDYHQISGTFNHLYTERDMLNLSISSSRYKTPVQDQTTYNHVAQLGWQHNFDEQIVTYISAGLNYAQAESTIPLLSFIGFDNKGIPYYFDNTTGKITPNQRYGVLENNAFGQVYRASVQKSFERGSVSLVGSQNQTPTAQGLQTRSEISIANTYKISERWASGLTASYASIEVTGQTNSQFNRTSYLISPNISWKWTNEINLGLSYTFRQQEFQGRQPSEGNVVQLQLNYQPQINRQVK